MHSHFSRTTYALFCAGLVLALASIATTFNAQLSLALVLGLIGLGVILVRPFLGLCLFVFLTQLGGLVNAVAGSLSEYVLEGLVAATLAGVILQAPSRPRYMRWGDNPLAFRITVLFFLCGIVSAQFAAFPGESFEALVKQASHVVVFFLIVVMATTKERIFALLLALFASTALSGSIAALEYLGIANLMGTATPGGRNNGAADLSNTTAGNMFLIGTFCAALLACRSPKWRKITIATAILGAGGVIFTVARSAMMLLMAGFCWLGFKMRRARYFPSIALLVIIGGVAALPAMPDKVWERFAELSDPSEDWTLGRRLGYHLIGFELLSEHPIVGIGPGNFGEHYATFEFRWVEGRRIATRGLHNTYLGVAVEYGIIGLALFVALIVTVLHGLHRARKRTRDPTLGHLAEAVQFALVIFLISIVMLPALSNKLLWFAFAMGTAIASIEQREFLARSRKVPDNPASLPALRTQGVS